MAQGHAAFPGPSGAPERRRLELRLAKEWDIPDILIAHQDDPQLYRRIGQERPPSGAELGRCSEAQAAERAAGIAVRLTVVLPGDDTCRGTARRP